MNKLVLILLLSFCMMPAPGLAAIVHRWSFNGNANDSVGNANGALLNLAEVSGGRLNLNGITAYADLPIGNTIASLTDATVEGWATWDVFQRAWGRIFDFGSSTGVYMFLSPRNGRSDNGSAVNTMRYAITNTGPFSEIQVNSARAFPVGLETHFAVTIDGDAGIAVLYIDGVLDSSGASLPPAALGNTTRNWLGRSQFTVDNNPYFDGSISEFRIYNTTLSAGEVLASFQRGTEFIPEPTSSVLLAIGLSLFARTGRRGNFRKGPDISPRDWVRCVD